MQFYIKKSLLETHTELEDLVGWEKFSVTVLFVLELRCVKRRIKILDLPSTVSAILISRETVWIRCHFSATKKLVVKKHSKIHFTTQILKFLC